MTAAAKPPKEVKPKLFKFEAGKTYECIKSTSPGYKLGQHYTCYTNEKGFRCLQGSDGYEDLCDMLVSDFRAV